jgi:hypothetical protein
MPMVRGGEKANNKKVGPPCGSQTKQENREGSKGKIFQKKKGYYGTRCAML